MRQSERAKYPGMRVAEAAIMRGFLLLHEGEYERFDYNVRVGIGRDPGAAFPDYVRRAALMSSQMRIDSVAWIGQQPTIIELKGFALVQAVQQLAVYGAVWQVDYPALAPPRLLLVCTNMEQGVSDTARNANIGVVIVKPALVGMA